MGCCFSNDEDKEDDVNNPNQPLLNPVDPQSSQNVGYSSTVERTQHKGDEPSALNRILQETASNVIDVAALDTHGMDQQEYMDRARHYSQRLSGWCNNTQHLRGPPALPMGVAAPQSVLSAPPVSPADLYLITCAAQQISKCLKEVKVKHKEDLVVPFGVP